MRKIKGGPARCPGKKGKRSKAALLVPAHKIRGEPNTQGGEIKQGDKDLILPEGVQ